MLKKLSFKFKKRFLVLLLLTILIGSIFFKPLYVKIFYWRYGKGYDMESEEYQTSPFDIERAYVTACSANHFRSLENLINSIREMNDQASIIIYDLGLTRRQRHLLDSRQMNDHLVVRDFQFEKYPNHFKMSNDAGQFAWKPVILMSLCKEFSGIIIWLDAGNFVLQPIKRTLKHILKEGVYSPCSYKTVKEWTHPGMLKYFNVENDETVLFAENVNAALVGIDTKNASAIQNIIKPWYSCALVESCISPQNSNRKNHRQDQAALSVIMAMNGMSCESDDARSGYYPFKAPNDVEIIIHQDSFTFFSYDVFFILSCITFLSLHCVFTLVQKIRKFK